MEKEVIEEIRRQKRKEKEHKELNVLLIPFPQLRK
jgi:hypothetical protein